MKKWLLGGILGAAALYSIPLSSDNTSENKPQITSVIAQEVLKEPVPVIKEPVIKEPTKSKDSLVELIEKEIRKQDRWVEDEIRQDYENDVKNKISIVLEPKSPGVNFGLLGHNAAFSPTKDQISLQVSNIERSVEALDHELWHSLYDGSGRKGILHGDNFVGPSLDEIGKYTEERLSGSLKPLSDLVKKNLSVLDDTTNYITKTKTFLDEANTLTGSMKRINRFFKSNETQGYTQQNVTDFKNAKDEYVKWINESKRIIDDKIDLHLNLIDVTEDDSNTLSKEIDVKVIEYEEHMEKGYEIVQKNNDVVKKIYGESFKKKFGKEHDRFAELDFMPYTSKASEEFLKDIKERLIKKSIKKNEAAYKEILSPNEVMARMVDSLYSLHYEGIEQNYFPLDKKDLDFLSRFEYKGEQLFKKGIEKYNLGLQMIEDGITPLAVKEQLEYATEFKYKGKDFSWPEADFSIKGKLPEKN